MPQAVYVPSRVGEGYFTDWQAPAAGATDNGKAWVYNSTTETYEPTTLSAVSPGGSSTHVQYNNAGAFAGDSGFTYAGSGVAALTGRLTVPEVRPVSDGIAAVTIQNVAGTLTVVAVDTTNSRAAINGDVSVATFTVNQHVDTSGLRLYGFDDQSAEYINMGINSSGTGFFSTTANMLFYSSGTQLSFKSANASGTVRFTNNANQIIMCAKQDLTIGFGNNTGPTATVDITGGGASFAPLRLQSGTAPTSPNDGDIWYPTSGRLTFRRNTTSEIFATGTQATGGAQTATGSWTATEQDMLQKVYDAARTFGLLS